jgi:hypothetical protein
MYKIFACISLHSLKARTYVNFVIFVTKSLKICRPILYHHTKLHVSGTTIEFWSKCRTFSTIALLLYVLYKIALKWDIILKS